ncbi:protein of unknown function DUF815 [Desulfotomaculum nigrificans CO-1-SRB]|uniref:AAA+ ATPase domain-containing protein n=1 Tax=Desulfotomaculum nigrificans (strain DSM 14880 / VKM B-2319 / CO-1-SRB) TaxID=868595 RepID=F6B7E1_DESCC|nr:ATP-binding protein [Desulfotomaculum nigrificans]AEF93391.1 protein of unknown function DUF815 [Desulfotomaculum nigrificans CO-1-SRB]
MTSENIVKSVYRALNSLTLFQNLQHDAAVKYFNKIINAAMVEQLDPWHLLGDYHRLMSLLLEQSAHKLLPPTGNLWQNHLLNLILLDDNLFARQAAAGQQVSAVLKAAYQHDLDMLQVLCQHGVQSLDCIFRGMDPYFKMGDLTEITVTADNHGIGREVLDLKRFLLGSTNWCEQVPQMISFYRRTGVGQFILYWAFRYEETGTGWQLTGIADPDPIQLHQLIGYQSQRQQVVDNTERLLQGFTAHNLLLYGDRGTGKSSTIKALIHRYGPDGLRLVQLPRKNLGSLQKLTQALSQLPLKFIIFIDDLSFEEKETEYKEFKTQLEGSLQQQPANVRIYVTSNQRNLIKEYFSDRNSGDGEVHMGDTAQEKLSLADRFGLKITFLAPDKEAYLQIVRELARQEAIDVDPETLEKLALQWTLWHNERSGRTARQFIDHIKGRTDLNIF